MASGKPKLFLFHFSGGNCYSYAFLTRHLKEFHTITIELPGRGERMKESLIQDFEVAAKDIFRKVNTSVNNYESFALYGHSMGAYFALKVAQMLEAIKKPPKCIIVSGNSGPGMDLNKHRYLLKGDDFIQELKFLGGVPDEILADKSMLEFFEPVLRADFALAAKNGLETSAKINIPVFATMGDEESTADKIKNWANYTTARFEFEILKGNHFFIHQNVERLANIIKEFYQDSLKPNSFYQKL